MIPSCNTTNKNWERYAYALLEPPRFFKLCGDVTSLQWYNTCQWMSELLLFHCNPAHTGKALFWIRGREWSSWSDLARCCSEASSCANHDSSRQTRNIWFLSSSGYK
jgi:hypothetical protein